MTGEEAEAAGSRAGRDPEAPEADERILSPGQEASSWKHCTGQ